MAYAFFGNAVFGSYLGIDKHGRHLGAQEEIKLCLYALVALSEDREAHSFLRSFSLFSLFQRALKFGAKVRLLRGKVCRKIRQNVPQNAAKCTLITFVSFVSFVT